MTEHMLRMQLDALLAAVQKDDSKAAQDLVLSLAGQALLDFNRIANALEALVKKGVT